MFRSLKAPAIGLSLISLVTVASVSYAPAIAYADTTSTTVAPSSASIVTLQQKGEAAIDARLTRITQLETVLASSNNMTSGHKATLTALLASDTSGLTTLRGQIVAETNRAALKLELTSIVHDYRIYVLVDPKVHLTRAADGITAASGKENDEATKLDGVVASLNAAGKNTTAVEAQLVTAHAQALSAQSAVVGQGDAVLALQATDYPSNENARDAVRTAVKAGAQDAKNASQALKSARAAIKALGGK